MPDSQCHSTHTSLAKTLTIRLEPENRCITIPRVKTVQQLLQFLNIPEETALVACGETLLTHDQHLPTTAPILVRKVRSLG